MHPIEHPETIMLIHHEMIRRELERGRHARRGRDSRDGVGRFRRALGRGLIALARRISPQAIGAGVPAGARH